MLGLIEDWITYCLECDGWRSTCQPHRHETRERA
jgi:hypothetical protein